MWGSILWSVMGLFPKHLQPIAEPGQAGTKKSPLAKAQSSNSQYFPNSHFHTNRHRRGAEYAEKNNLYLPGDTGKYKIPAYVFSRFPIS